jgi:prepilin signal peptidase PulO-like enzyme (type II secretory pathway)
MGEALAIEAHRPLASPRRRILTAASAVAAGGVVLARYEGSAPGRVAAFATVCLVVLSAIDLERRRIPNAIVLPAAAIVLAGRLVVEPGRTWLWIGASLGAAAAFFVLALVRPGALGMGDAKLVFLIGAALGPAIIAGLLIGTLTAAAFGIGLIARYGRLAGRRTIAYAPFLSFGAFLALLLLRP